MQAAPDDDTTPDGPEDAWELPRSFDGFALVRELGRGGMGSVHLAQDTTLDRLVAIKFITGAGEPGSEARARFLIEARAIARLQHPNVVGVHRLGEVAGRPYLVSEFVDGHTLQQEPKPVTWARALALGLGVARGLAAAHESGVLHRDVKPANILVTSRGEVKLLDFGIAKLVGTVSAPRTAGPPPLEGSATRPLTRDGELLGTPLFMAPELFSGAPATPASDVYAVGVVLHELLSGEVPHLAAAALGVRALAAAVTSAEVPPLASRSPAVPRPLTAVVDRCLAREAAQRFSDARALVDALSDVQVVYHPAAVRDALNPADVTARVVGSLARLAPSIDRLVADFYERLFATRPDVRRLFPADLTAQRGKLGAMLQLIEGDLDRPERLVPILEDLGLRHAAYGIHAADFDAVGAALVGAVAALDPAWDPTLARAWRAAYEQLAAAMRRGLLEARAA